MTTKQPKAQTEALPQNPAAQRPRCSRCPACGSELSKRHRRSLTPLEWQKLLTAYWMQAWMSECETRRALPSGQVGVQRLPKRI